MGAERNNPETTLEELLAAADSARAERAAVEAIDHTVDALAFEVDQERYLLPLADAVEVAPVGKAARVPGAPAFVIGIVAMRGEIVPLIDLPRLLGRDSGRADGRRKVVVVSSKKGPIGLACDRILRVQGYDGKQVVAAAAPSPAIGGTVDLEGSPFALLVVSGIAAMLERGDRAGRGSGS